MQKIVIVSATRKDPDAFAKDTLLGRTMKALAWDSRISYRLTGSNQRGLPHVYNGAIDKSKDDEILLFIHDDVLIEDFHLFARLEEAMKTFDVVGVAGNIEINPMQAGWTHMIQPNGELKVCDRSVLSGMV